MKPVKLVQGFGESFVRHPNVIRKELRRTRRALREFEAKTLDDPIEIAVNKSAIEEAERHIAALEKELMKDWAPTP